MNISSFVLCHFHKERMSLQIMTGTARSDDEQWRSRQNLFRTLFFYLLFRISMMSK